MKKHIKSGVYKQMQKFADLTITMVLKGNMTRAKKCLDAADSLLVNGNYQTRNAISNVYLYSVSAVLELHHYNLQQLFPRHLQAEYVRQINAF